MRAGWPRICFRAAWRCTRSPRPAGTTAGPAGPARPVRDVVDRPAKRHRTGARDACPNELGVPIVRGAEVVGLTQDGDGVTVECADGETVRAKYVVGCDGAHSTIRNLVGIDFVGKQYETHILLADVALSRAPEDTLDRCDERARRRAHDPVRRRLVPRHRMGPVARTGAADRTRDVWTRSAIRSCASPVRTSA